MTDRRSSDHFDGRRFHNPEPTAHGSATTLLRWALTRKPVEATEDEVGMNRRSRSARLRVIELT